MFWSGHDMGGWGYASMVVGMVLFWVLIIAATVTLIRVSGGAAQQRPISEPEPLRESPEQLLAGRFARGEIDDAEYRHRLDVLRTMPHD